MIKDTFHNARHTIIKRKTGTGSHHSSVPVPAFRALISSSTYIYIIVFFIALLFSKALPALSSEGSIIQPAEKSGAAYFRKTFTIHGFPAFAKLRVSEAYGYSIYINGVFFISHQPCFVCSEMHSLVYDVTQFLISGNNAIAVETVHDASFALDLDITLANGRTQRLATDASWLALANKSRSVIEESFNGSASRTVFIQDARLIPDVMLNPVPEYADSAGIYMKFSEWHDADYNDASWPRAVETGVLDFETRQTSAEVSQFQLFDLNAGIYDYGDVLPGWQFIGRKKVSGCPPVSQDLPRTQIQLPKSPQSQLTVTTPGDMGAFITFGENTSYTEDLFVRLYSSEGDEIIDAVTGVDARCVSGVNIPSVSGRVERYIARKGIQTWRPHNNGGRLYLIIRNAHEPLFIHSVGIQ